MVSDEFKKVIVFFKERETFKKQLKIAIKKYGVANIPADLQRSIPTDMKVLYELPWYLNPIVWLRSLQIAYLNAHNECIRRILNA